MFEKNIPLPITQLVTFPKYEPTGHSPNRKEKNSEEVTIKNIKIKTRNSRSMKSIDYLRRRTMKHTNYLSYDMGSTRYVKYITTIP